MWCSWRMIVAVCTTRDQLRWFLRSSPGPLKAGTSLRVESHHTPRTRSVGPNSAIPMNARIASINTWKARRAAIQPRPNPNPVANGPGSRRSGVIDPDRGYHCGLATYTGRDGELPGNGKSASRSRALAADGACTSSTRGAPSTVPQRSQNDAPGRGRVRHLTHGAPGRIGGGARRGAPIVMPSGTFVSLMPATHARDRVHPSRTSARMQVRRDSSRGLGRLTT